MRRIHLSTMALIAASMLACAPKATPEVLLEADRAFSEATVARRLEGFRSFLADDAATLRPDSPVIAGKEEVARRWASLLENPSLSIEWTPESGVISEAGDLGYTLGTYEIRATTEAGETVTGETGKYVTIWRREADGTYKVVFDSGVSDTRPGS